jgi:hypothetical protein
MAKKEEMEVKVAELKKKLSDTPKTASSTTRTRATRKSAAAKPAKAKEQTTSSTDTDDSEFGLGLKDVEHVLKEHGVNIDDIKGFWDQISSELKDLPAKKPLVTALGAFLIGFVAGRMSRN